MLEPTVPRLRHVWVAEIGNHGAPRPGVVVDWQPAPVHYANAGSWVALTVTVPFDGALLIQWVPASRLLA